MQMVIKKLGEYSMMNIEEIADEELKTDCIILQNAIYDVKKKKYPFRNINPDPIREVMNKMMSTECFNSMLEKYAPDKFVAHEFFETVKILKTESMLNQH